MKTIDVIGGTDDPSEGPLIDDVRAALEPLADPGRAGPMSAYMRGQFPFLGVQAGPRRAATRAALRARGQIPDWPWVHALWAQPEREFQYVAADHLARARLSAADLPQLRRIITTKSWWDTVDMLAKPIGRAAAPETMREWAVEENPWIRRVAILHQLGRRESTDADLLAEIILANLGGGGFFIDKAIGWALRDYARTDPDWVRSFVGKHELAPLARREALKHFR